MLVVSNYVLNNRGNFRLKFFRRFKNIAVFVVGSLILPHTYIKNYFCFRFPTAILDIMYKIVH